MVRMKYLTPDIWTKRAEQHRDLVGPYCDAYLKRRDHQQKHPVHDFLFTYYNCSPHKLKQWVPSYNEELYMTPQLLQEYPWLSESWFCVRHDMLSYDFQRIKNKVKELATFVAQLCKNISQRVPRFGCYGLHEWAMVYQLPSEDIRHHTHRLRIHSDELTHFVQSQTLCCTHYDAFRFFTSEARPLNLFKPTLETRLDMEQGGCVHANMDLYKWATKFWPWIGSDFIAKTFLLALEGRELDMRASPYDLRDEGYQPICIEMEEGRRQYQKEQQQYAQRAVSVRHELQQFCENFMILQHEG